MVIGIVLGAGVSRRLGRPKQTLAFGGRPLLAHVVADIEAAASLDRVILVVGSDEVADAVTPGRAEIVRNEEPKAGCASSLLAGLDHAGEADAIVMLLGDMPGVTAEVVDAVVGEWQAHPTWAAVTQYDGGLGHPFIFSSDAFPALRELHGDKAVWKIVDREPEDRVARIEIETPLPRDIDTWDDYDAVHAAFGFDPADKTISRPAQEDRPG